MLRKRERWAIADARSSLPLRYRFAKALRGEIYFKAIRVSAIRIKVN